MDYLFFTRKNGDIDSMENIVDLDTDEKRRVFIGDDEAVNFEIINSDNLPISAKWDGEKYISNINPQIALRDQRDLDLMSVTVEINGNEIWANPTEEQNISGRLRQMELAGADTCKWIQGDSIYPLTKAELEKVLTDGTEKCAKIFDDYIEAVEAL